jgi:uncharacterized protein YbaR (Trm112 family)
MPLDATLKELLVCPQCHGELEERDNGLLCAREGLLFPMRDGLPVMLLEEATKISAPDAAPDAAPGDAAQAASSNTNFSQPSQVEPSQDAI